MCTHATVLLTARKPVHVVAQRLGHVLPGTQQETAATFARLIEGAA